MKKIFLIVIALLVGFVIYSCSCLTCGSKEEANVPLDVLEKADSFIVSKTGGHFFNNYIAIDFFRTKHTAPYYEMVYGLYIPEKSYVDALIKFTVDSVGNVVEKRDIIGIPNCRFYPLECEFNIDEQTARQIATDNGLEEGIKEWKAGFIWNAKYGKYVWHLLSTLEEMEGEFGYKAKGKEVIIDPSNGEVIALNDWDIM
jgi:hypothetical protein